MCRACLCDGIFMDDAGISFLCLLLSRLFLCCPFFPLHFPFFFVFPSILFIFSFLHPYLLCLFTALSFFSSIFLLIPCPLSFISSPLPSLLSLFPLAYPSLLPLSLSSSPLSYPSLLPLSPTPLSYPSPSLPPIQYVLSSSSLSSMF